MYGEGLIKGLGITLHHFFGKAITEQYPERKPNLPPRSHGFFTLDEESCNACGTCANWCPNNAITIESYRDENNKRRISAQKIKLMYCMFCGLCVENCPREALHFTSDFELSSYNKDGLEYDLVALARKGKPGPVVPARQDVSGGEV